MTNPLDSHVTARFRSRGRFTSTTYALDGFCADFHKEMRRLLVSKSRFKKWQIDEICQREVLDLLERRTDLEARYSDGAHYARARVWHAGEDFKRQERGQRGQGTHLKAQSDGTQAVGRVCISFDAPRGEGDRTLADVLGATWEWEGDFIDQLDRLELLDQAMIGVPSDTRRIMVDVAAGTTFENAARSEGIRRETANRKVRAAVEAIRARREAGEL